MSTNTPATRREFLRRAGLTAAGITVAPTILPSSVFGANAPSNRINLGMIGMGKMNHGHLGGFLSRSDCQVLAVCDVESIRLNKCKDEVERRYGERKAGGKFKGCDTYGDYRELLARDDIDAVVIATPNHWHGIISVEACRAGKDIYCEKPMTFTIYEAKKVASAVNKYNRVFQVGSQQRSDRTFRFGAELVRNGRIGKVKEVNVNVGGPANPVHLKAEPTPPTLDWDMWLGPAPYRPYSSVLCPLDNWRVFPNWRGNWDYGSGGMTDFGAHHFDIAQWGLGMDGSGPVEVIPPNGKDVDRLTYVYENGVVMHRGGATRGSATEWIGEKGSVGVNRGSRLVVTPDKLKKEKFGPDEIHLYESRDHKGNWLDCIRTRRKTICTAEIGKSTALVCHIGVIAYRLNRPLKWDPKAERFIGDDEANRLLKRPMRGPWTI